MHAKARGLFFLFVLVIIPLVFSLMAPRFPTTHREAVGKEGPSRPVIRNPSKNPGSSPISSYQPSSIYKTNLTNKLNLARGTLRAGHGNQIENGKVLLDLRNNLFSLPSETASTLIGDFLEDTARDAPTHIEFSVGKLGNLKGHPTLRVALLDWLGQIHPLKAASIAERILSNPTTADEWAICLRNYAHVHTEPSDLDFLRKKTEELIGNTKWQESPSVGFLEAFDTLVYARATESSPLLFRLVADQNPSMKPLSYAAYLTLDRLTISDPVTMMEQFTAPTSLALLESRGPMVANMFARADLRDPKQRALVRNYLLSASRTADEMLAFSEVYPNVNYTVSQNLLTTVVTPTRDEIVSNDTEALAIVQEWRLDPAFKPIEAYLNQMVNRIGIFVSQTTQAPSQREKL
jgi:hypothetical protein